MAMWRRSAKLKSATSYFVRDCGKLLCFPCRSFSNNVQPVVHLHNSITKADLSLVGISHSCPKSADFVKHMIRELMPNVVAVELCSDRADSVLLDDWHESITWKEFWSLKGGLKEKILNFIFSELCAPDDWTQSVNEMKVAIQEGLALGANIVYMDQDDDVTIKRVAQEFSLMEVIWVILRRKGIFRQYPVFFKSLDIGKDAMMHPKALEELVRFADKYLPGLARTLLHERNEYMVKILRKLSGSIVGVVGAAHVQGIQKLWQEAEVSALHVQEMHKLWQEV